jgi:hypothetical protein
MFPQVRAVHSNLSGAVRQVRILPRALVKSINSNALTILTRHGPEPVTCADAEAFPIPRLIHARQQGPGRRKPQLTGRQ